MLPLSRRDLLKSNSALAVIPVLLSSLGCQQLESESEGRVEDKDSAQPVTKSEQGSSYETDMAKVKVQYLEMVTPEMDALIAQYEKTHGVEFSEPNAAFGGARTINLDGGLLGVRKPLRESETPVIRPYMLVDDIAHYGWHFAFCSAAAQDRQIDNIPSIPCGTSGRLCRGP